MSSYENQLSATPSVSRRSVVKAGAAATVAATVWAEPTIKGLARRPAYAGAGSTSTTGCMPSMEYFLDFGRDSKTAVVFAERPATVSLTFVEENKVCLQVDVEGCQCSFTTREPIFSYLPQPGGLPDSTGFFETLADGTRAICFKWEAGTDQVPRTIAIKEELCWECKPL